MKANTSGLRLLNQWMDGDLTPQKYRSLRVLTLAKHQQLLLMICFLKKKSLVHRVLWDNTALLSVSHALSACKQEEVLVLVLGLTKSASLVSIMCYRCAYFRDRIMRHAKSSAVPRSTTCHSFVLLSFPSYFRSELS